MQLTGRLLNRSLLRRLLRETSGLAMTEFALSIPLLFTVGLWGVETANQAITQMQLSQLAVHIADNASRVGDTSMLENRKIYESDINDLLLGANIQAGSRMSILENGRVIISSLEVVPGTEDQQYIHWQRCKGKKQVQSAYGDEGDGMNLGIPGMGPAGEEVMAFDDEAVIFVEIRYTYQPLISEAFTYVSELDAIASFNVRDDRDLSQIYQRDPTDPDTVASCSVFDATTT